jgi:hypothetical protein
MWLPFFGLSDYKASSDYNVSSDYNASNVL